MALHTGWLDRECTTKCTFNDSKYSNITVRILLRILLRIQITEVWISELLNSKKVKETYGFLNCALKTILQ